MDQVTIQSLSAQLIENPLYLLEMPESIFELFETADNESRMESDCNSSSAYSSFQCSRCESRSDISQLDDFEQNDFELRLGEYLATSSISDANEDSLPVLEMSSKDSAEIFSAENMDTVVKEDSRGLPKRPSVIDFFNDEASSDLMQDDEAQTSVCGSFEERPLELMTRSRPASACSSVSTKSIGSSSRGSCSRMKRNIKRSQHSSGNVLHFLLQMLKDESMQSIIQWMDEEEGVFTILDKDEILHAWNEGKTRPVKEWNNFAKTLRSHYKSRGKTKPKFFPVSKQYTWRFSQEFLKSHH